MLIWLHEWMSQKYYLSTHDANVNVNLMLESEIRIKNGIMINVHVSVKNIYVKKYCLWNLAACNCKNGKHLASITDDSVITYDDILEQKKTVSTNFNERKVTCETKNFYVLLALYEILHFYWWLLVCTVTW